MDFKWKARAMIETMKYEQVVCLVNLLEVFLASDDARPIDKVPSSTKKQITDIDNTEEDIMTNWLSPRKAAQFIKHQNPVSPIGETTLRKLIKDGFPCIQLGSKTLINMDTFDDDIATFSHRQKLNEFRNNGGIRRLKG